jgi:ornithine cyclodeaminase
MVEESEILVTCTSAREILVRSEWVHPGMHITAVGADAPGKQELDPEILRRADRVVCDSRAQVLTQGECQHVVDPSAPGDASWLTELGEIVAGMAPGRVRNDEVTVCDLTGVGMQDAAIARYVLARALGAVDVRVTEPVETRDVSG